MAPRFPETIDGFIDEVPTSEKTLLVVNRTGPSPLIGLLDRAFDDQPVAVADRHVPEGTDDLVCPVDGGEVVATTPLRSLTETFLLVNTDWYRLGAHRLTSESVPDVLTNLDEVEFTLRGFSESNKEKLLLVVISRFVEARALEAAG